MAYEATTWQTGDIITAEKLNNMESGIAALEKTKNINITFDSYFGSKNYYIATTATQYAGQTSDTEINIVLPLNQWIYAWVNGSLLGCSAKDASGEYVGTYNKIRIDNAMLAICILSEDVAELEFYEEE